jgi:hypothetical protein
MYGIEGRKERRGVHSSLYCSALSCLVLPSLVCIYQTIRSPIGLDTITATDYPRTLFHCLTSVSSLSFSLPLLFLPTRSQTKKLNWTQAELVQASINYATSLGEREIAGHYSSYTERERQPTLSSPLLSMHTILTERTLVVSYRCSRSPSLPPPDPSPPCL